MRGDECAFLLPLDVTRQECSAQDPFTVYAERNERTPRHRFSDGHAPECLCKTSFQETIMHKPKRRFHYGDDVMTVVIASSQGSRLPPLTDKRSGAVVEASHTAGIHSIKMH